MTRLSAIVTIATCSAAFLVSGCACSGSADAECAPAEADATHPVAVNARCPVETGDSTTGAHAVLVAHKGKTVALCCPGCAPTWNAMSDAEKDAALAAVVDVK